ncbi:MFS transporter [Actinokineospora sp. HUAS TT18]|uniref:MFS transporter n=1 Tax=Actinokineospora sp. HUAS TT18 TaxID=3447451 RepID=UPI003F51C5A7
MASAGEKITDGGYGQIAARVDRMPITSVHRRTVRLLSTGLFFDAFDSISIAVALTVLIDLFDLTIGQAGQLIAAGYLGQMLGALIVGALSERYGRKRATVFALTVFGLLSLGVAASTSLATLMAFRLLQGVGLGALVPVSAALLSEVLSPRSRGRIVILYLTAFPWGLLAAPLLGAILFANLDPDTAWRVLFAVGSLPLALAAICWFALPESPRWLAAKGRYREADAILTRMEANVEVDRTVSLATPAAEPAETTPQPETQLRELFSANFRRRTLALWATWFCVFFVTYGYTVWLPTMYVKLGGLAPSKSLLMTVIVSAAGLVTVYVVSMVVDRFGRRPLLIIAFVVIAAGTGVGAIGVSIIGLTAWPALLSVGISIAVGVGIPASLLYLYTAELYPTRMRSWATSAGSSLNRAASITAPLVVAAILGAGGGVTQVFLLLLGVAIVGLGAVSAIGIETKGRSLEEIAQ